MLIVCPNCASEYTLAAERVGTAGRQVRCAVCGETWFAKPTVEAGPGRDLAPLPGFSDPSGSPVIDVVAQPVSRAALRRRRSTPPAKSPGRWEERVALLAAVLALSGVAAAFALRPALVNAWPESASLFAALGLPTNVVGLELTEVASTVAEEDGKRVLVVEGEIRSAAPFPVGVPRLEFTIADERGDSLYQWSTKAPVPEVMPGEAARFTARLASPPPAGRHISVSFRTGRDGEAIASR